MKMKPVLSLRVRIARVTAFFLFAALSSWTPLHGAELPQATTQPSYALLKGMNEFGLWLGGSPTSSKIVGDTGNRRLLLVGLRYGRILAAWESISLEYTLDVFPAAVVFEPGGGSSTYGAGVSPLGFKLNFRQQGRIKPFLGGSIGFLYLEDDVPVPDSSRLNFATEIGLGLQFFLDPKRAVTLGYKFQHISNAGISRNNPGMDSHIFYAGFSFFTP